MKQQIHITSTNIKEEDQKAIINVDEHKPEAIRNTLIACVVNLLESNKHTTLKIEKVLHNPYYHKDCVYYWSKSNVVRSTSGDEPYIQQSHHCKELNKRIDKTTCSNCKFYKPKK